MKKLFALFVALALLAGCAATNYKLARNKGNDVKNGMTVAEAVAIIGLPPTNQNETSVEWRRGNIQVYDGTQNGSIRFELLDGKVVNIPEGGIFSPAAAEKMRKLRADENARQVAAWNAALDAQHARATEQAAEAEERARRMAEQAKLDAEADEARKEAEAKKLADQLLKEVAAARRSSFTCSDKVTCGKAFALAQIFINDNADQKIQVATDTIVETYNPTEGGKLGMKIVKTPGRGANEVISIVPNCKEERFFALSCSMRRTHAYESFRPFIERSLSR